MELHTAPARLVRVSAKDMIYKQLKIINKIEYQSKTEKE